MASGRFSINSLSLDFFIPDKVMKQVFPQFPRVAENIMYQFSAEFRGLSILRAKVDYLSKQLQIGQVLTLINADDVTRLNNCLMTFRELVIPCIAKSNQTVEHMNMETEALGRWLKAQGEESIRCMKDMTATAIRELEADFAAKQDAERHVVAAARKKKKKHVWQRKKSQEPGTSSAVAKKKRG